LNPYGPGNTYTAVLSHAAAAHHGPLVRLSLVPENYAVEWEPHATPMARTPLPDGSSAYTVDWTQVPEGAEPVVERRVAALLAQTGGTSTECQLTRFGYRHPDPDGLSTLEVVEEF
jgi:hypothetical protein